MSKIVGIIPVSAKTNASLANKKYVANNTIKKRILSDMNSLQQMGYKKSKPNQQEKQSIMPENNRFYKNFFALQ